MKRSIKSILAKGLAIAMAVSVMGAGTADAAAKKPSLAKKVSVTVKKTKTVKVKSKKKIKKITVKFAKKKIAKLVKANAKKKTIKIKGLKKGSTKMTVKVKVGKKTYTLKSTVTVKKASVKPTAAPTDSTKPTEAPTAAPTEVPSDEPASLAGETFVDNNGATQTITENYSVAITELNETTFTSCTKREDGAGAQDDIFYDEEAGSVTFTSAKDYNSGVSFYVNPCTSEDELVDISATRGEGFVGFQNGAKDVFDYDYVRVKVTSANEMNMRAYCGNGQLESAGFPGSSDAEVYEGGWIGPTAGTDTPYMESDGGVGNKVLDDYVTRVLYIPFSSLPNVDKTNWTAIAFCPQRAGEEVTIHSIDFVKVKVEKVVESIEVTAAKTELANGKATSCTAAINPKDATRTAVKWTSSDETLATVNFKGGVVAAAEGSGTVTITAEATDGSGVKGSVDIQIGAAEEAVVKTHKVDLTKVVANSNDGAGSIAVSATAAGLEFVAGTSMQYVDWSAYLADNKLDLTAYDTIKVTWDVRDADGNVVTDYAGAEGAPTYGKIAFATAENLNGYGNGIDVNYEGADDTSANTAWLAAPYAGATNVLTVAKTNPVELSTVAGFNLQVSSLPATMKMVVTDITFEKATVVDLTKVVANSNNGSGSIAVSATAAGLEFVAGTSMQYVDWSAYIAENKIDLTNLTSIEVTWEVHDANEAVVTDYAGAEGAPTYGKIAFATAENLNGYGNGIDVNYEGADDTSANTAWLAAPYAGATNVLTVAKTNPVELSTVAGFNLQVSSMPADMHMVVKEIKFVY